MNNKELYKSNGNRLIEILEKHGYEGYFVGGCVRDMIMNREYTDIDIAASSLPEITLEIFRNEGYRVIETGMRHGTVTVIMDKMPFEVTTYRIDGEYRDCRHPEKVEFTLDIIADLARRDFTVNAMAMDRKGNIVDPFGGMEDIRKKTIRAVGDPYERFREDALRILRGCRFASTLEFTIEENTKKAMEELCPLMEKVAGERLFVEFKKLTEGKDCGMVLYKYSHIIDKILSPAKFTVLLKKYPRFIFYGTLASIENNFINITSALLCLCGGDRNGTLTMVNDFIKRTKCDRYTANSLMYITSSVYDPLITTKKELNREMGKHGIGTVTSCLELRQALYLSEVIPFEEETEKALKNAAEITKDGVITLRCLDINGNDLMEAGFRKGKETGEMLNYLMDMVAEGNIENKKEALLSCAKQKSV